LDALPYPDFDDYFEVVERLPVISSLPLHLVIETSRGCWWGQKHHCTFCGLNGQGMSFRYKSAPRALTELRWLLEKYGVHTKRISAADNIIPVEYFHSFLPELERLDTNLDLFYETKANLTENQIIQYRRAGLNEIQPGIESLSTRVLKLMRKGVSALQNVQLLKWCAQYGVHVHWNYLFGFPGETADDYAGQAELFAKIRHLTPPVGCTAVRFDRFSPYHKTPETFGLTGVRPYPAYHFIYREIAPSEVMKLAYYFVADFNGQELVDSYTSGVVNSVAVWRRLSDRTTLCHTTESARSVVFDGRDSEKLCVFVLEGVHHCVFQRCASITAWHSAVSELSRERWSGADVRESLDRLASRSLLIEEDDRFLAVSIPLGFAYTPPEAARRRVLAHLGYRDKTPEIGDEVQVPASVCEVFR
jgi:ribosomal peptide maturation radical SAM protein 1